MKAPSTLSAYMVCEAAWAHSRSPPSASSAASSSPSTARASAASAPATAAARSSCSRVRIAGDLRVGVDPYTRTAVSNRPVD